MSAIDNCYRQIDKYNGLLNSLYSLIDYLSKSINPCMKIKDKLDKEYTINLNISPLSSDCLKLNDDINETSNYLKNVIIPEIEKSIHRLKVEINALQEEERRKNTEAKRKAKKKSKNV